MEIAKIEDHGVTVVSVQGMIKLGESARDFSEYLKSLLSKGARSVLIDLSNTDQVDSTGLGELVGYIQRFSAEGRNIALLNPYSRIMKLLELTRLNEVIPIFQDRNAAIAQLGGQ